MHKLLWQTIWFMLKSCFLFRSLEFWFRLGRGCLHDQSLIKTLGTKYLMSFPSRNISDTLTAQLLAGGTEHVPRDYMARPLEACTWFPSPLPHASYLIADFALCLSSVINLSHEQDYVHLVSAPSDSPKPGWGEGEGWPWGLLTQDV